MTTSKTTKQVIKKSKSVNSAQISVVPSSTGDVQLVVKDLSTAGEPWKKKRKVVNVLPDSLENQQENLVVMLY